MKMMKDKESNREDYLLQDTKKTTFGIKFIIGALALLIVAVVISGFAFNVF